MDKKTKCIVWSAVHFLAAHILLGAYTYYFVQKYMKALGEQNIAVFCLVMFSSVSFWVFGLYLMRVLCKNCCREMLVRAGNVLLWLFVITMVIINSFVYILFYDSVTHAEIIPRPQANMLISIFDVLLLRNCVDIWIRNHSTKDTDGEKSIF